MPEEDERSVGRREDDASMAVVAHRLGEVERAVLRLGSQIDGLQFVRRDVYEANQITSDQTHRALQTDIDEVRRLAVWALSTIGVALLGAVVAGIGRLAGL